MKRTKKFRTLRFALCIYFAFCILHSALALPAFAAENPTTTDKGATISVTGSYDPNAYERVISVDVSWGSMVFTYREGSMWKPEDHTEVDTKGWISEGNDITVTNHSTADILARFEFESNVEGFGGNFYNAQSGGEKTNTATVPTAVGTLPKDAPKATVWFRAEEGTLSSDVASLGTLTVTLYDTLTAIDAREMDAAQLQAAVEVALANEPATLHITMPADADFEMLAAINDAIGTEHKVDLILYGMAEKLVYTWNDYITVKFICDSHDMVKATGNGTSHTLTCANCDYSTTESCTLTHTPAGNGTHTSSCDCGYYTTVDCNLDNVVYTWAYDNSACTASATCTVCKAEITETATAAYNSEGVLAADFENALFETQTITHEHTWDGKTCTVCGQTKVTLELTGDGKGTTLILTVPENVYTPSITEAFEQVSSLTLTHIIVRGNVAETQACYTMISNARDGKPVYFENLTENNYIALNGVQFTVKCVAQNDDKYVLVSETEQWRWASSNGYTQSEVISYVDNSGTGARIADKNGIEWSWYLNKLLEYYAGNGLNENNSPKLLLFMENGVVHCSQVLTNGTYREDFYGINERDTSFSYHWFPVFDIPLSAAE